MFLFYQTNNIIIFYVFKNLVNDGPVPWASRDQLTFIAEQVSHHPPSKHLFLNQVSKLEDLDNSFLFMIN
jgi:hypothetical protein